MLQSQLLRCPKILDTQWMQTAMKITTCKIQSWTQHQWLQGKTSKNKSVQEYAGKSNFESFATQFTTVEKTGPSNDKDLSNIMLSLLNE